MDVKYITNYYSFWVYIWFVLFQNKIINYSPYHMFVLCVIHDIVMTIINYKKIKFNKLTILRWSYIFMMHYFPLTILKPEISYKSIGFNIILLSIYLFTFKYKTYNPIDSYLKNEFKENTTFDTYFKLRFGNMTFGLFVWIFCLFVSITYSKIFNHLIY